MMDTAVPGSSGVGTPDGPNPWWADLDDLRRQFPRGNPCSGLLWWIGGWGYPTCWGRCAVDVEMICTENVFQPNTNVYTCLIQACL